MDDFPWKQFAMWIGGSFVALLQLVGLWQIKRIGELEAGKADKLDVRDLMSEWRAEREAAAERWHTDRAAAEQSRESLRQEIKAVAISVATIEGILDQMPKRSTD